MIRGLAAYVIGNVLGVFAAVGTMYWVVALTTGRQLELGDVAGVVTGLLITYWWLGWAMREYVAPAAGRTQGWPAGRYREGQSVTWVGSTYSETGIDGTQVRVQPGDVGEVVADDLTSRGYRELTVTFPATGAFSCDASDIESREG